MRRLTGVAFLALSVNAFSQYPGAIPPPADYKKGYDSITEADAKSILGFLAGPECEGRGTGQPGFQKAADFIAKKFKAAGLKPLGDNGTYFQNVTYYNAHSGPVTVVDADGKTLDLPVVFNGAADIAGKGELAVVVVPSATDELTEAQLDSLKGKIVLYSGPAGRTKALRQLNISDAAAVWTLTDKPPVAVGRVEQRKPTTGASVTFSGRLAKDKAAALSPKVKAAVKASVITVESLGITVQVSSKAVVDEVKVPNVVGILEGSDPVLKSEVVGIGAHLDHLGIQGGVVYPGADDDGSGSTSITLIAQAMAKNPVKPKRSIVFMAFHGEEKGLWGSAYLSEHPPIPFEKWTAELQMDMVGRDSEGVQNGDTSRNDDVNQNRDTIRLVGSKRISLELDTLIQDLNKYVGFKFKYDAEDVYTRSDHYNFARKGVPIAFLFDGFHPDYHQPTDTVDKIDFLKLTNSARLYYLVGEELANRTEKVKHDGAG